jgi:hypothetical protein
MGGWVYDPKIGRFVSADPTLQAPYAPQDLNRYSYVLNSPFAYTDPTGYGLLGDLLDPLGILGGLADAAENLVGAIFDAAGNVLDYAAQGIEHLAQEVKTYWKVIVVVVAAVYTGGLAVAAVGDGFWGAVAGAATFGGTASGGLVALNGGTSTQVLTATVVGGVSSGALAAMGYAMGGGYTARLFSGAVNGAISRGSVNGALAAFIPYDLGMGGLYNSSPYVNLAIREVVAGMEGEIIGGDEMAREEIIGVAETEAAGFIVSYGAELAYNGNLAAPTWDSDNGVWRFDVNTGGWLTIGNVITGPKFSYYSNGPELLRHELVHANLQSALGLNYLPVTGISVGIGLLTAYQGAFAERWPLQSYGYECLGIISGIPCLGGN